MRIESATAADYDAVDAMFAKLDAWHVPIDPSRVRVVKSEARSREYFRDCISGPDKALFIVREGNQSTGFANVAVVSVAEKSMQVARRYVLIDNYFIDERFRRRGYATALYHRIRTWGQSKGIHVIELSVYAGNVEAIGFYRSLGFCTYMHRMQINVSNA